MMSIATALEAINVFRIHASTPTQLQVLRVAACLPLVLGVSCGSPKPPPNVLLVSLDTVRADRLGAYGSKAGLTPALDALASESTVYARCIATAPWTVPSHASMFTGRFPFEHGAHSFEIDTARDNVHALSESHTTLAEVLNDGGYQTAGFVANAVYLHPRYGMAQGFARWDLYREPGVDLNQRALQWLDDCEGERPFFLFVNYLDAHRPYNVAAFDGEPEVPPTEHPALLLDRLIETVMVRGESPDELAAKVEAQYDRGVRHADRAVGELLAALRERGLLQNTLVVVTSDHGEYFGEHGLVEHSKDVYAEALEVPLIVKPPSTTDVAQVRPTAVSSSVDVPGLIAQHIPGALGERARGLFPRLPGGHPVIAENYYSRPRDLLRPEFGDRFRRTRTALYSGAWKLILSSDGADELYRYAAGEEHNELESERDFFERTRVKLERVLSSGRYHRGADEGPPATDDAHYEAMRDLGYLGDDEDDGE